MNPFAKKIAWFVLPLCLGVSSVAAAQPGYYQGQPPPPRPPGLYRSGLVLGVALGGGRAGASCDGCDSYGGFAGEFHIGGMVSPQLALEGDFSTIIRSVGYNQTISYNNGYLAAQFWAIPIFWIKGGIGVGFLSFDDNWTGYSIQSKTGGSLMFALGVEVLQTPSFALDVQLRFAGTRFDENNTVNSVAIMVGANWY
jgi:hypothetical protein